LAEKSALTSSRKRKKEKAVNPETKNLSDVNGAAGVGPKGLLLGKMTRRTPREVHRTGKAQKKKKRKGDAGYFPENPTQ